METLQAHQTETKLFPKLWKAIKAEHNERLNKFIAELKAITEREKLDTWYYRELLPKGKNVSQFTLQELISYLTERKQKQHNNRLQKELSQLLFIERSGSFISAKISVEWKVSRMWGSNPSRCKLSKSINELLKALYLVKEKKPTVKNHELFGYGSGYGILPSLEGGVGVSCYPKIFQKIGFKFNTIASGKTFDVFTVTK